METVEIDPLEYVETDEDEEKRRVRSADEQKSRLHGWVAATVAVSRAITW